MMIVIEGSIGAGKTTLAKELHKRHPDSKYIAETVSDSKLFESFSKDKARFGASFQFERLGERLKAYMECEGGKWNIYDQSVSYDENVFALGNTKDGNITPAEFEVYKELRELWENSIVAVHPDVIVSLVIDDDVMIEHIKERGRPEEQGDYSYQIELNHLAQDFVFDNRMGQGNVLLLHVTEDTNTEELADLVEEFVENM